MRLARWPALIVLLAAIAGLVMLDQRDPAVERSELAVEAQPPLPLAVGAGALSSTWYCAGGTGTAGGLADHSVTITNPTDQIVRGTVEVFGTEIVGDGSLVYLQPSEVAIEVAPQASASIRLADVVLGAWVGALLELDSASAVVSHRVDGPTGSDSAPCASSASRNWYFPAGSTSRDAREFVAIFNPFPDDAVVNVSFATDDGSRAPQRFDGVPVPAGTLVPLEITDVVARWAQLSVAVESRVGRAVVDRIVTYDGSEGLTGLTLGSGAPRAAPVWLFAAGAATAGTVQSYAIYNPSTELSAEVDLEVRLDAPETNGRVEPFEISIAPRRRVVVVVNRDDIHPVSSNATVETGDRVPQGVGHTVTVRSFNGVPVVVEQLTTAVAVAAPDPPVESDDVEAAGGAEAEVAPPTAAAAEPAVGLGVATALGAPATATVLVLPVPGGEQVSLAVMNPSFATIARVTVSAVVDGEVTALADFTDIEIGPQRRILIPRLGSLVAGDVSMVLIEASSGVVAQRLSGSEGASGLSAASGIPVGGEVESPELFGDVPAPGS